MAARQTPLFVTFEGIDGCGKSTQAVLAAKYLKEQGQKVKLLREPGSTAAAEKIRALLLDKRLAITEKAELLLYEAARAEITTREILPALAAGEIVLCDRFFDSTTAYQGYGRRLDLRVVRSLHRVAVGDLVPDLTLLFDVSIETAFDRRGGRADRLESQSRAFFKRVRAGFLEIARKERTRVKIIDGSLPPEEVFEQVKPLLDAKLK